MSNYKSSWVILVLFGPFAAFDKVDHDILSLGWKTCSVST